MLFSVISPVPEVIPEIFLYVCKNIIKGKIMKIPVGIQSFDRIMEEGYVRVDKTDLIYSLTHEGSICFLSCSRPFGKNLLISTLENDYPGRKELFRVQGRGQSSAVRAGDG